MVLCLKLQMLSFCYENTKEKLKSHREMQGILHSKKMRGHLSWLICLGPKNCQKRCDVFMYKDLKIKKKLWL